MDWHTTCQCSFSPYTSQKLKFPKFSFLISWPLTMTIQAMWGMFLAAFMCFSPYLVIRVFFGAGWGVVPWGGP